MSGLLARTAAYFLVPATPVATRVVSAAVARRAAVLGAERDARAMAAAVATELRRVAGAGAACAAVWQPRRDVAELAEIASAATPPPPATLAAPAAAKLAARLEGQGLEATARGRLAWVSLPHDPAQAAASWERLANRIDAPAVLAVAGPRDGAFEGALAEVETLVVVTPRDAEPVLVELALCSLAGPRVIAVPPLAAAARVVALSGLGRAAVARELAEAVRA